MSHENFFNMLNEAPRLKHLWDKEKNNMDMLGFEAELNVLSSGEVELAKFFASVWLGNNKDYGFDLVEAVRQIDPKGRDLILNWMRDPFWP